MRSFKTDSDSTQIWQAAEKLVSPTPADREQALSFLREQGAISNSALIAYLVATRLSDPDLEIRFHMIQALGEVLSAEDDAEIIDDQILRYVQGYLAHLEETQLIKLLEVSDQYLSAEKPLVAILKLCSYAGELFGGIVNDRKIPLSLRQQAAYFSGEIGFLETIPALQNLLHRIDKTRNNPERMTGRKKAAEEDMLYYFAAAALEKMDLRFPTRKVQI